MLIAAAVLPSPHPQVWFALMDLPALPHVLLDEQSGKTLPGATEEVSLPAKRRELPVWLL